MHVGIILDGNRRWAKEKGLESLKGHEKGAEALSDLLVELDKDSKGVNTLTVYAFSCENFNRSEKEVTYLMLLFEKMLVKLNKHVKNKDIKVNVLGSRERLSKKLVKIIDTLENDTKDKTGYTFNICLNYSGRSEIVNAVKQIISEGINEDEITEELISDYLYTKGQNDPDLIIRTSGENRLSNFLTYQSSYSELIFIEENWPDFTIDTLTRCLDIYNNRNRRFGK